MFTLPAPLRYRDYRAYWVSRFLTTIAGQMLVIVIGWQVYDIARETRSQGDSAFLLGMIGLVQFVPMFALTLVVGVIADRVDRRHIARAAIALQFLCAALLAWLSLLHQVTLRRVEPVEPGRGCGKRSHGRTLREHRSDWKAVNRRLAQAAAPWQRHCHGDCNPRSDHPPGDAR